jgi:hypothetical protein
MSFFYADNSIYTVHGMAGELRKWTKEVLQNISSVQTDWLLCDIDIWKQKAASNSLKRLLSNH